jgi:hypothetical protein
MEASSEIDERLRQLSERMVVQSEQIANLIKIAENSHNSFITLSKDVASINMDVASGKTALNTMKGLGVVFIALFGWFTQHLLTSYEEGDSKQQIQIESLKVDLNELKSHSSQNDATMNATQKQINDLDNRLTIQGVRR